jgi:hypothetical protein
MNRIDEVIPFNKLEEWKFVNNTNNYHPMHVHGVLFQVYSRNGNTILAPNDKGWKDTVLVNPNETVQTLVKFIDYSGTYLLHCHNLEHEDDGMMLNIEIDNPTNIENEDPSPNNFELSQNYPNPFNPSTTINYKLTIAGFVTISIFNLLGRKIETIFTGHKSSGQHSIVYTNKSLASGTYIYELRMNDRALRKKMTLLK